ncbi:MAG TPA: TrkA C-terminal domain-containing protein [Jatrophihabitantaceae bacterium]|nr:TrkA C-terminal domain-containing protein [Jatrophihabitantaceae bacterium]
MYAIIGLLLVATVSLVITRVATVILTATGMSTEAARFQARSAFTGAGFTTSESEKVVEHPVRRRVIAVLMLLGNVGIVAAASSTILGFRGGAFGHAWWRLLLLVLGLLALVFISRSRVVDRRLTRLIARLLDRFTDIDTRDIAELLNLSGPYAVNELAVCADDWVAGRSLAALDLRGEGVVILGIIRRGGRYLGAPTGRTVVQEGDTLVAYGTGDQLRELDNRPAGVEGDQAHRRALEHQLQVEQAEHALETSS